MVITLSYLLPFLEYLIKTITKSIKWPKKKKERETGRERDGRQNFTVASTQVFSCEKSVLEIYATWLCT